MKPSSLFSPQRRGLYFGILILTLPLYAIGFLLLSNAVALPALPTPNPTSLATTTGTPTITPSSTTTPTEEPTATFTGVRPSATRRPTETETRTPTETATREPTDTPRPSPTETPTIVRPTRTPTEPPPPPSAT